MLDNSPRAQLQILRQARSNHLRVATEALDARNAALARLATIDVEIESYESEERSRNRRRRLASQKVAHARYRDGTPKDKAKHLEIARHYAWTQKPRRAPLPPGSPMLLAVLRLKEFERLLSVRYGRTLPDDDAGEDELFIAVQFISQLQGDITEKVVAWARVWAPWCSPENAALLAAKALRHRYRFKADVLAERVGLTYAERMALDIRTIGSTDVGPAERERLRRQRYNAKRREKRRAAGVKPREMYEQNSIESEAPWEAEGISRSTWQRRRRAARVCGDPSRVELSQAYTNPQTLAAENGSLEAPAGSLSANSGSDRREKRASGAHDLSAASIGSVGASAGCRPVSGGPPAPVAPGADVAREDPLAPPRPRALHRTTALAPVERLGLGFLKNDALNSRLRPWPSNEGRPMPNGNFRGWNNCCLCAESFRLRGRDEAFCSDDCLQLSRAGFRTEGMA